MTSLSDAIRAKIRERFIAPSDRDRAESLVLEYGEGEREVERVRLDIFELCGSSLEKLSYLVEAAKRDYRDIIFWAEYENDDRGIPVLKPKFQKTPPHS
jgi:hypothetical protein